MNVRIYLVSGQEIGPQLARVIQAGQTVEIYCSDGESDEVRRTCVRLIRRLFGCE